MAVLYNGTPWVWCSFTKGNSLFCFAVAIAIAAELAIPTCLRLNVIRHNDCFEQCRYTIDMGIEYSPMRSWVWSALGFIAHGLPPFPPPQGWDWAGPRASHLILMRCAYHQHFWWHCRYMQIIRITKLILSRASNICL